MRKLAVLLLLVVLIPTTAWALNVDNLLATIAMPLAVAAVADAPDVQPSALTDLVTTLNQANVPPEQFVEVIRYVPVAMVDQNGQTFVQYVREQTLQGVTGSSLVDAIADRLRTRYQLSPTLALSEPATTFVVRDDYVVTRVTTLAPSDSLSLIALPLAVAAVADITGVSQTELGNFVAALNQANVPPVQVVQVLRYTPVALIDDGQPFVQFVQEQTTQGITGPALVTVIERRLQTYYPAQTQITVAAPSPQPVFVERDFVPRAVVTRVEEFRAHPHGGPPGQLKKQLGLQTGAEVVHRERQVPAQTVFVQHEKHHGRGHGKHEVAMPPPMISAVPQPQMPVVVQQPEHSNGKGPGGNGPPGQQKEKEHGGGGKKHGKGDL